jgi:hypothetical protein
MHDLKAAIRTVASVVCTLSLLSVTTFASAESVRPEVGRPLQAAQDALKAKRYADAAAKVRDAENAPNKTPAEEFTIERMRGAVAAASGDLATATKSYEAIVASGKLQGAEQTRMVQAVAGMYYQQREYTKAAVWTQRYLKEGGSDPQMRSILLQSYYLGGDCASVSRTLQGDLTDDTSGRAPPEEQLQMLASCYQKNKDNNGYALALEKLVAYYPKRDYWIDLLSRVERKSGFSDRLALDVYRLKLAAGLMSTSSDYMEMTQLALGDEYTAEAKKVVDQGFASKALGAGADLERQKRLSDLANKRFTEGQAALAKDEAAAQAERDGNNLVALGYNYVGYGQAAKGISLMEQGIKKGGLRRPEDAKLHLGLAYLQAGQKAKGLQVLKTVGGTDGTAELARLWTLQARKMA